MPWTIDDSHARGTPNLPNACGRNYYAWRRLVRDHQMHPSEAADQVGDAHYESYGGDKYTIRLSQGHRVYFLVDEGEEHVTVVKVGTHQTPRGW